MEKEKMNLKRASYIAFKIQPVEYIVFHLYDYCKQIMRANGLGASEEGIGRTLRKLREEGYINYKPTSKKGHYVKILPPEKIEGEQLELI